MKVAINAGHTKEGSGYGAVGYMKESEETRKIVNELLVHFRRKGHEAINCTVDHAVSQNDYLKQTVNLANKSDADLFLSVHFNSGGGKGVECYTWKGEQLRISENICKNISILGFPNRGVKDGSGLYVIKKTTMTAILIEVCFVDKMADVALYKELGPKQIALSIYDAVVN
jgi:N-acetylmuramoyl-L-alanine amidase